MRHTITISALAVSMGCAAPPVAAPSGGLEARGPLGLPAEAATPQFPRSTLQNRFVFEVGGAYWNELGSLSTAGSGFSPDQFAGFDRWGFNFDFSYEHQARIDRGNELTVGLEFGFSTFRNDGQGVFGDTSIDANQFRITPTAHLYFPVGDGVLLAPSVGIGAYYLGVFENDYYYGWWYNGHKLHDEWALGGFVGLNLDIEVGPSTDLRIDNRLHYAEFGRVDSLLPAQSSLDGPIYIIEIGIVTRF